MTALEILKDRVKLYRASATDKRRAAFANDQMTARLMAEAAIQDADAEELEAAIRKLEEE